MVETDARIAAHAVASAADGVVVVAVDGSIRYANPAMGRIVGCAPDDLLGRQVDELVPDAHRRGHDRLRDLYADDPEPRPMGTGLDLGLRRLDGEVVAVEISLSPLAIDGETLVVATVRDVEERRESQRKLAMAHEELALVGERERIGRDLHDVVLQHLYGMGLSLQALGRRSAAVDTGVADEIDRFVGEVDRVISEVRTIVFTLGTASRASSFGQSVTDVMAQASRVLGFTPSLRLEGPVDTVLDPARASELLASMREALGNVARHAAASEAEVTVVATGSRVTLEVVDNGAGPPADIASAVSGGHGLANLRARAERFGGTCELRRGSPSGAVLRWSVPIDERA